MLNEFNYNSVITSSKDRMQLLILPVSNNVLSLSFKGEAIRVLPRTVETRARSYIISWNCGSRSALCNSLAPLSKSAPLLKMSIIKLSFCFNRSSRLSIIFKRIFVVLSYWYKVGEK